ncbi:MAG: hypothetical protein J4N98_02600 [Chloroflexi bacterium]|nr:hypothetical protein [Chloroflexota bacterium]
MPNRWVLASVRYICEPVFGMGRIDLVGGNGGRARVYTQAGTRDPAPIYLKSQYKDPANDRSLALALTRNVVRAAGHGRTWRA